MKRIVYTIVLFLVCNISYAQINDHVKIDKSEIQSEKINGFDKVIWKSDYKTTEIGKPELPVYTSSSLSKVQSNSTNSSYDEISPATLYQNIPNPFNTTTTIGFYLPNTVNAATIYVYDMNGVQLKRMILTK